MIADVVTLETEARHARERYRLYQANAHGPRATDPSYLRELERLSQLAERRLRRAKSGQGWGSATGNGLQARP